MSQILKPNPIGVNVINEIRYGLIRPSPVGTIHLGCPVHMNDDCHAVLLVGGEQVCYGRNDKIVFGGPQNPSCRKICPYNHTVIIVWFGRRNLRESFLDPGSCGRQNCWIRIARFAGEQAQTWRQVVSDNAPRSLVALLRVGQTWEPRAELLVTSSQSKRVFLGSFNQINNFLLWPRGWMLLVILSNSCIYSPKHTIYYIILYYIILYYTILYDNMLCFVMLYYIILF